MVDAPHGPDDPAPAPKVEGIFRSGSITAISVVVGFSLGFLSRWSGLPGKWERSDVFAVVAITLGVALQIKALVDLLAIRSVIVAHYERSIRIFVIGLILVALGVVAAIFAEIIGYGGHALKG
jgi:hypothetical protein